MKIVYGYKVIIAIALCVILVSLFAVSFAVPNAHAEQLEWARVINDNTSLYATESSSKVICLLEKSYYVNVLEETDTMLFVSIMRHNRDFPEICGYVYKDDVEVCEEPKTPYYPTETITVNGDSAQLKLSPTPNADTIIVAINMQQLLYYGKIVSYSKTWYYVYYAGKFGYVETDNCTEVKIALHPTPLKQDVAVTAPPADTEIPTTPPAETETPQATLPTSEILLIVFVVLLAVGLILALFAPGNKRKTAEVFDKEI